MSPAAIQTEHNQRIAQVIDYIFRHSNENLSIDILAALAHYSPDHLQKLFRQAVGTPAANPISSCGTNFISP